jgi:alkylhydroperoxidase family enzyme
MPHITLKQGLPGIRGPMVFSPETTKPLCDLVEVLLTGPHSLTTAEREMIATYVSSQNDCYFCQHAHGSIVAQHLGGKPADYEICRRHEARLREHNPLQQNEGVAQHCRKSAAGRKASHHG